MDKRRFGRTGHLSTVAILGGAAFGQASQEETDAAMERVIAAGVNHIDVAPSYGQAEIRLGPWLAHERKRFFLGCKTQERTRDGAMAELQRSLERLQVEAFDLYQIHAITSLAELDKVTEHGGALDAIRDARELGLTRFIGITGHGVHTPGIFLEALRRFDFDSVIFPLNFVQMANPIYRRDAEALLKECSARDMGVMVIKTVCRAPWGDRPHTYNTWYEPFDDADHIQPAVDFALSHELTGLCTPADLRILPLVLDACERFTPIGATQRENLIASASEYGPLFV